VADCHIEPDWVLIYKKEGDKLILGETGTHSDLFGK
jgi:mRNA interferase YafQ